MSKILLKGNEAIAEGVIRAGCRYFFGYPITPQNDIPEIMSRRLPEMGGDFVQSESEVAAVNMVLGAAAAGARVMTSTSGPGIDLMTEGIGHLVAQQLPCLIVDVMRGGPGTGALHATQADFVLSGRLRGDARLITLAPWNVQEMLDFPALAFELAERYRNPALLLTDAALGNLYEPVQWEDVPPARPSEKAWALTGARGRQRNLSLGHFLEVEAYDRFHLHLREKYQRIMEKEQRYETCFLDPDTELVIVAYGIAARAAIKAVRALRREGLSVGLLRPVTLFPFPTTAVQELADRGVRFLAVEMSAGQMADQVCLSAPGAVTYCRPGVARANPPRSAEIESWAREILAGSQRGGAATVASEKGRGS
ncbi:MAG: 3-methyl-2-oxobutanoate dehydrogenase subunit VorB [Thermaerobacterales bacterium]